MARRIERIEYMQEQAILVVSFGTSYKETLEKTIGAIEISIQRAFPDRKVYRAFTSRMIKTKLEEENIFVCNVQEALEQIIADGRTKELIVQPTHIINGIEYDFMREQVAPYKEKFEKIFFGNPLLSTIEDYKELATILKESYAIEKDEAMVLMGHGSLHHANSAYPAFEYVLKDAGYDNIYIGTVEGYPTLEEVKRQLERKHVRKVCLVPMMIVAGEHANQDMIEKDNSWKAQLEREGYAVRYYRKGLGELEKIQNMFVRHIRESRAV